MQSNFSCCLELLILSTDFCLQQSLHHDQKDTSGTSEARSSLAVHPSNCLWKCPKDEKSFRHEMEWGLNRYPRIWYCDRNIKGTTCGTSHHKDFEIPFVFDCYLLPRKTSLAKSHLRVATFGPFASFRCRDGCSQANSVLSIWWGAADKIDACCPLFGETDVVVSWYCGGELVFVFAICHSLGWSGLKPVQKGSMNEVLFVVIVKPIFWDLEPRFPPILKVSISFHRFIKCTFQEICSKLLSCSGFFCATFSTPGAWELLLHHRPWVETKHLCGATEEQRAAPGGEQSHLLVWIRNSDAFDILKERFLFSSNFWD